MINYLYRYDLSSYEFDAIELRVFSIIKETPCGAWIMVHDKKKFVNLQAHKQFACSTKDDALYSFIKRKESHRAILTEQLRQCNLALYLAKLDGVDCKEVIDDKLEFDL